MAKVTNFNGFNQVDHDISVLVKPIEKNSKIQIPNSKRITALAVILTKEGSEKLMQPYILALSLTNMYEPLEFGYWNLGFQPIVNENLNYKS